MERSFQIIALFTAEGPIESWQVYHLFLVDALREVVHEGLQCWHELRGARF
jgi:hypothetical protein